MGKEGFPTFIWGGWLTGSLFLRKPWGPPTLESYLNPSLLWLLITHTFGQLTNAEMILVTKSGDNASVLKKDKLLFYINICVTATLVGISMFLKIFFLVKAKPLAKLLNRLYHHQLVGGVTLGWRWWWRALYVRKVISILLMTTSVSVMSYTFVPVFIKSSIFGGMLGRVGFTIYCALGFFLTEVSVVIAFFLVSVVTLHLLMAYEDYCLQIVKHVEGLLLQKRVDPEKPLDFRCMREYFLKGFDELEELFQLADGIVPVLALIIIVSAMLLIIPAFYGLLIVEGHGHSFHLVKLSFATLVGKQLFNLMLVVVGQLARDTIERCRGRILEMQRQLGPSEEDKEEYDIRDVLILASDFDWKLSASKFFVLDKDILRGIMSTALTYTVMLVQLEISLD